VVWRLCVSSVLCASVSPAVALAQSSLQVPIQFDFLDPGAKSLALGSAFVGLADDATAASANPAGLVQLGRPEFSAEGRFRGLEQPFLSAGRLSGTPTGLGQDTLAGPVFGQITSQTFGLGFFSFVYPRTKAAVAVYLHEPLQVEHDFESPGVFQFRPPNSQSRDTAFSGVRSIHVKNYGAAGAFQLSPQVSVGAGFSLYTFDLTFDFRRFQHANNDFYAPPDPSLEVFHFTQDGDDVGVAANVGVLVSATPRVKLGAAFRRGPRFTFTTSSTGLVGTQRTVDADFRVPDVMAGGVSIRPTDTFLVTAQYNRVLHSQLQHEYVDILVNQPGSQDRADRFTIADGNEFHLGAEFVLAAVKTAPALRGGVWRDSDHSVQYAPSPADDFFDEQMRISLGPGEASWHYTFGVGASLSSNLEWSFATDLTSSTRVVSGSAIVRFNRRSPKKPSD
jgi:long-chain fatty acid transport protein